jgi:hypothetical protein
MKKATREEFIELLDNFKEKNNIKGTQFDHYAIFKFYKATLLDEFYDMTLAKTDSVDDPIMINYSKANMLVRENDRLVTVSQDPEIVPIIKDKNLPSVQKFHDIIQNSHHFKDAVDGLVAEFGDSICSGNNLKGIKCLRLIENFDGLRTALKKDDVNEHSILYYLDNIIDYMPGDSLRKYELVSLFRGRTNDDADHMMDIFYEKFNKFFDLFKMKESMILGRLLNAKTEDQTLNTPLLEQFIDEIKQAHPDWFVSFNESLTHCMTDDNAIKASGIPLGVATADFDVIDPKSFMATAYPSYDDGFSWLSNRFMTSENNFVHLYGDNAFFKVYYHNLHIENQNGLAFCKGVDSDVAFCIRYSDRQDFVKPVLDYLNENKIIVDLSKDSSLYHYINKEDLATLIKTDYPDLVLVNHELGYNKLDAILNAKSYQDVLDIYQDKVDLNVVKSIKSKPTF